MRRGSLLSHSSNRCSSPGGADAVFHRGCGLLVLRFQRLLLSSSQASTRMAAAPCLALGRLAPEDFVPAPAHSLAPCVEFRSCAGTRFTSTIEAQLGIRLECGTGSDIDAANELIGALGLWNRLT